MFDRPIDWLVKHPRLFKVVNPVVSLFICTCAKHTMRRCFVSLVLAFSIVIAAAAIGNWLATVLAVVLCLRYIKEGSKAAQEFRAEESMRKSMENIGKLLDQMRPPMPEEQYDGQYEEPQRKM